MTDSSQPFTSWSVILDAQRLNCAAPIGVRTNEWLALILRLKFIAKFLNTTNCELLFDELGLFLHSIMFGCAGHRIPDRAICSFEVAKEIEKLYELQELCRAGVPPLRT
jgi:hypothetical protein